MTKPANAFAGLKQRDQAFEEFSHLLLTLQVRPGQFVTQRELVHLTGMPLGAIRELVPRLEADGLLSTQPKRGMQIVHIDLDLIRDAFQLRMALEKEAAAFFAAHGNAAEIDHLRAQHLNLLKDAETEITSELLERAQQTDWDFHEWLVDRMGNMIISKIYRVNSIKIRLIRAERSRMDAGMLKDVMHDHLMIIDAFEAHDEARAVTAIEAHINNARQRAFAP
ncbi:GntR family transcriptional regulator [Mariluticola halotolerans]|uniref:GntR family transcriptional regulator n=1 Tax=Mariluticola halotolerans TaxID=2909283 RepID=UPI0026E1B3B8|nr:GntR family transcriptional regulator [Mariluticola halotolerans]UJQ96095.1 GntR family transcriptional regulator [Mariluticola halotolerans]